MTPVDIDFLERTAGIADVRQIAHVFMVFCRVGGCVMLAPGFGSVFVPPRVRLFLAVFVALLIAPAVPMIAAAEAGVNLQLLGGCVRELVIGLTIGVLGRLFLAMVEFLSTVASIGVGMANPFGFSVEQGEVLPPLAAFVSLGATTLIFALDLHWQIVIGVAGSFAVAPLGESPRADFALRQAADVLAQASLLALRVSSPFLTYAIIVNFAFSLINRLTPQVAIFYISTPFVIAGAALIMYDGLYAFLSEYMASFGGWLTRG